MKLIIVHYHLRPGGVRRVMEIATPAIMNTRGSPFTGIILAAGEMNDPEWMGAFKKQVTPWPVEFRLARSFHYFSELTKAQARGIGQEVAEVLADVQTRGLVWAHNLSIGRNLLLLQSLTQGCLDRDFELVHHHHDWWFDNRWARRQEFPAQGFRQLKQVDDLLFHPGKGAHITINRPDFKILSRFRKKVAWMPNPVAPSITKGKKAVFKDGRPLWLLPCRVLRRKNIAEGLLLGRWLRPDALVASTAGISSPTEADYGTRLHQAAKENRWNFKLGLVNESKASVSELIARSEVLLFTSIQEGFGLPLIEAAAACKPLIARNLPQVTPDLEKIGFCFPHLYNEVRVDTSLFDFRAELLRQRRLFIRWQKLIPKKQRSLLGTPALQEGSEGKPFPFSRLTLTAQLEVLREPCDLSWRLCAPLNRKISEWRKSARSGGLVPVQVNAKASRWMQPQAYARRFLNFLGGKAGTEATANGEISNVFLQERFQTVNLFPLLWSSET